MSAQFARQAERKNASAYSDALPTPVEPTLPLLRALQQCRQQTLALTAGLSDADMTVQSMEDASPAKWHLAHTTWFFEEFVLRPFAAGYRLFDPHYRYLFNSYYEAVGPRHARPRRGMLTRPSITEVLSYRAHVDQALACLISDGTADYLQDDCQARIQLGIQHEQQHQELLLTDLLHLFAQNPLRPAYRQATSSKLPLPRTALHAVGTDAAFTAFDGGVFAVGHRDAGFAFDCEGPAHDVLLRPFALANRPVTNAEWCNFMADGGYLTASLWLSDGWQRVQNESWRAPLYWFEEDGEWAQMTLYGEVPIDPDAPVCHISLFEADAFARWAGKRLPTEFEWEIAAQHQLTLPQAKHRGAIEGHFADAQHFLPSVAFDNLQTPLRQLFGGVWEWTASPFSAYPGYRPSSGPIGEYNGKFMCGQFVLRGASCVTPAGHMRATYRNFFPPHARWQFAGVRLAEDRS